MSNPQTLHRWYNSIRNISHSTKKVFLFIGFFSVILSTTTMFNSHAKQQLNYTFQKVESFKEKLNFQWTNAVQNSNCFNKEWNRPTIQYEVKRREVYRGVQEMSNFVQGEMKKIKKSGKDLTYEQLADLADEIISLANERERYNLN